MVTGLGNIGISVKPAGIRSGRRKTTIRVVDVAGTLVTGSRCENFISNRKNLQKPSKAEKLPLQLCGHLSCDCSAFEWNRVQSFAKKNVPLPDVGDGRRTPKSKKNPASFGTKSFLTKIISPPDAATHGLGI